MNRERFHNELAMRLGYECIVKDNRISISIEESDDPWVTLNVHGHIVQFKASDNAEIINLKFSLDIQSVIKHIVDAVHCSYYEANNYLF